jgi:hypothetical protein
VLTVIRSNKRLPAAAATLTDVGSGLDRNRFKSTTSFEFWASKSLSTQSVHRGARIADLFRAGHSISAC